MKLPLSCTRLDLWRLDTRTNLLRPPSVPPLLSLLSGSCCRFSCLSALLEPLLQSVVESTSLPPLVYVKKEALFEEGWPARYRRAGESRKRKGLSKSRSACKGRRAARALQQETEEELDYMLQRSPGLMPKGS
ncbi:hypothetical protein GOP47_0010960 [Adiantum capillus-veneris]|uniref:Uncharacterized protein n=1 Tax=Adiantum capillus-veneris TaxID=13818 RepID=A0A9D4UW91_ADICA|nr:hypothetical protein GOP47_0010960 [Adiantum capillus-veneris]